MYYQRDKNKATRKGQMVTLANPLGPTGQASLGNCPLQVPLKSNEVMCSKRTGPPDWTCGQRTAMRYGCTCGKHLISIHPEYGFAHPTSQSQQHVTLRRSGNCGPFSNLGSSQQTLVRAKACQKKLSL